MNISRIVSHALRLIPWSIRGRIKRVSGIAQLQRLVFSRTLDGKEFSHVVDAGPARGIKFLICLPEDKGIWTGTYEEEFSARLAEAVRPTMVTYDIGSWHGFFAGVMAAQGARVVHVFEPLPINADRIRHLISLNPTRSIILHSHAVGDRDTEMELIVMPETSMAKLEESSFQSEKTSNLRVRAQVRSIDSMVATGEIDPPDLVKIDVEGAELLVLEGARATLNTHRPEIFAEIHSAELLAQCRSFLHCAGYTLEVIGDVHANARTNDVCQIRAAFD